MGTTKPNTYNKLTKYDCKIRLKRLKRPHVPGSRRIYSGTYTNQDFIPPLCCHQYPLGRTYKSLNAAVYFNNKIIKPAIICELWGKLIQLCVPNLGFLKSKLCEVTKASLNNLVYNEHLAWFNCVEVSRNFGPKWNLFHYVLVESSGNNWRT